MNIYKFEFKTQLRSTITWTICFVILGLAFIKGVYPMYSEGAELIENALANMPEGFVKTFGLDIGTIFSFGGFYGFIFGYMAMVGAIMAVIVSVAIFSREKRGKCMDFVMTKPVSRNKIFWEKFLAGFSILTAMNIVYGLFLFAIQGDTDKAFVLSIFSLYFTQMVFFAIGILIGILLKKVRSVSGVGMAVGIVGFALSAIVGLLEKEQLLILAPLKYFDPGAIYLNGGYTTKFVVASIIIFFICMVISYFKYCKSDIDAV